LIVVRIADRSRAEFQMRTSSIAPLKKPSGTPVVVSALAIAACCTLWDCTGWPTDSSVSSWPSR
jgi:hypothetical protein